MRAKMAKKKDVVVVSLSGRIDMEYAEPFRQACLTDIAARGKNIVFNMEDLSFVGSNGITPFVRTIVDLVQSQNSTLKFCGVGAEFKKIFAASPLQNIEVFENEDSAVEAFDKRIEEVYSIPSLKPLKAGES